MTNLLDDFDLDIQKTISEAGVMQLANSANASNFGCFTNMIGCPPHTVSFTCSNTCHSCPNPTGGCGTGPSGGNNPDPAACLR